MKRSIIITLHVAYWLVFTLFTLSTMMVAERTFKGFAMLSFFLSALLAVGCFYTCYLVLVPKFLATKKIRQFILSTVGTCVIGAVIITSISMLLGYLAEGGQKPASVSELVVVILNLVVIVIFHVFIGMVHAAHASFMKGFIIWYDEIHLKEVLEKKNMEIQMSLIKAKINPHFLFNTLNNIDVLIKTNAALASLYLQKLSHIMRFALYENQIEKISLTKELAVMSEYVELESIRTANKDFISFNISGEPGDIVIAPMLFIPFLENAFKHSGKNAGQTIAVKIQIADGKIHFECRNNITERKGESDGGLGIQLMKDRLNLLYPDKHKLVLQNENDYFQVDLTVEAA